jgi:quercetin dioxygenase-like cupin family protein
VSALEIVQIDEAAAGPPPEPANFIGRVRMQNLAALAGTDSLEYLAVFFDAGARTRPHIHETDQMLFFVRGSGFVSFPGEPEQRIPEGGIVAIAAGVLHMHGATDDSPICHIAIRAPSPTDWHPVVPDEWSGLARSPD